MVENRAGTGSGPRLALGSCLLVGTALLAGCSGTPSAGSELAATASSRPPQTSADTSARPSAPRVATSTSTGSPTGPAPSGSGRPAPEVLASQTVPLPAEPGATMTISVLSLRVIGELTTLEIEVVPAAENLESANLLTVFGREPLPELLDPVNLKAYSEVLGPRGLAELASVQMTDNEATVLTFYYAAPQDDVDTLEVVLGSGLPTFHDVPLQG